MGTYLTDSGTVLYWWENVGKEELDELDGAALEPSFIPTEHTPIFLPYLLGERAPIYDENARGVLCELAGLDPDHPLFDKVLALVENGKVI